MANILKKWVESDNRELKRLTKIADKVEAYAQDMAELSDDELKALGIPYVSRYREYRWLYHHSPQRKHPVCFPSPRVQA